LEKNQYEQIKKKDIGHILITVDNYWLVSKSFNFNLPWTGYKHKMILMKSPENLFLL